MILKPFFSYYGSKWRLIPKYPRPLHNLIVEPFAGSASYSLHYSDRQVHLLDLSPTVVGIWEFLIKSTHDEIASLPDTVNHVDDLSAPQEAKDLVGFWLARNVERPRKSPVAWARSGQYPRSFWGPSIKSRILKQKPFIKHWKVSLGSYTDLDSQDQNITWFIDPPYNNKAGRHYPFKFSDYEHLSQWCVSNSGQVVVCENEGARWLDFKPLGALHRMNKSSRGAPSQEVVWCKE